MSRCRVDAKSVVGMWFLVDHIKQENPRAGVVYFELGAIKDVAGGPLARPRSLPFLFHRN